MSRYILRRTLYVIPLIFGVSLVTFFLFHFVGGNPCYNMVGRHASAESLAICNRDLGFDQPLPAQYLRYLKEMATLDFGRSFSTHQKVSKMILTNMRPSLALTVPAFVIGNLVAIALGLLVALFRGRFLDRAVMLVCVMGMSLSVLAYILLGQYFLAYKFGLFPISGYAPGWALASYLALPILIWVVVGLGYDVRFFRTVMCEELHQDYIRTARAKGMGWGAILFKHVLKNAMIPVITHVVIQIPFLITGSLLLENFFQIPGLGYAVVDAINNSDFPVLKALVFIGAVAFIFFNLISDLLYTWLDPRIRLGRSS